ncbi:nucleotidyltransferase domain-containing protein [Paenibacillus sp. sptzw28]|uniref:nucleotidyltransferase domain-containing protein n=1 Tax=Paenibacillus sp. sptzw28 TaxID=715179 RepID=UPI001C6E81E2|nr:nucleotidyltransferase domain-containing protein [Paenibacillus sp. sptzw28]QYR19183.1 nucleotidyltransferase domain-containing protein [Paenibacillus sp. sptzw28]
MDIRYEPIMEYVVKQFSEHLGSRLKSIYVKGSIARGDAIWGISDMDLVLAFDTPTQEDTLIKNRVEATIRNMPGGDALVIQRIADDRLEHMDSNTRAYWLYSSWFDSQVLYGEHPTSFLPSPPKCQEIAIAILSILSEEGKDTDALTFLDAKGTRLVSKRILQSMAMLLVYNGVAAYVPLLQIQNYTFPPEIQPHIPIVIDAFINPQEKIDPIKLINAWNTTWQHINNQIFNK